MESYLVLSQERRQKVHGYTPVEASFFPLHARLKALTQGMDVSVQSFGLGIGLAHQQRIFEHFYRVNG